MDGALAASKVGVAICRDLVKTDPAFLCAVIASTCSLNNLSVQLRALRRMEEALVANEEAVEIYRVLANTNSEAFNPNLASSLNNLSIRLSFLGRSEDALVAIEETVEKLKSTGHREQQGLQLSPCNIFGQSDHSAQ